MVTVYPVEMSVDLRPVYHTRPLTVRIGIDDDIEEISIRDLTTKSFSFSSNGACVLRIEFNDKQDQEAVIIEQVSFFGIKDPRFVWSGVYEPHYPESWAAEQRALGKAPQTKLCPHSYLSWPGPWTLTFELPVFTWIHRVQSLGWIYD